MDDEDRSLDRPDFGDIIDRDAFEQILEMDDEDDTRDFSRQIVYDFFEQATGTFETMDKALADEDLKSLSELGHFLKGSSATLGLSKVRDACEKIQNWGHQLDDTGVHDIERTEALRRIKSILPMVRRDCNECETRLKRFYGTLPSE